MRFFIPYGPMLRKAKKNHTRYIKKIKFKKKQQKKYEWSGDMMYRYHSTKFGVNLFADFQENGCYAQTIYTVQMIDTCMITGGQSGANESHPHAQLTTPSLSITVM